MIMTEIQKSKMTVNVLHKLRDSLSISLVEPLFFIFKKHINKKILRIHKISKMMPDLHFTESEILNLTNHIPSRKMQLTLSAILALSIVILWCFLYYQENKFSNYY